MLNAAILEGHDVPHRVLLVEAPSHGTSDRDAFSVADAVAILAKAADLPRGSRWATALLQGMRTGECLGLTRDNVDVTRRLITVAWQLQSLPYADKRDPEGVPTSRRVRGSTPHRRLPPGPPQDPRWMARHSHDPVDPRRPPGVARSRTE